MSILHDADDASDAIQESMVKAFAALQKESRDFEVLPWLFRIVHNESISFLRKRRPEANIDLVAESGYDSTTQSAENRARLEQLQTDLDALGERQRGALIMRELSGLSHEQIAVALNCSSAGAKQAVFEARSGLTEMQQGREMECELVQRALSDDDGRVLKGRAIRAHLRDCVICSSFRDAIGTRQKDLAMLAPGLPAAALAALLANFAGSGATIGLGSSGSLIAGGAIGKTVGAVAITATLAGGVVTAHHVADRNETPAPQIATVGSDGSAVQPGSASDAVAKARRKAAQRRTAGAGNARSSSPKSAKGAANGKALGKTKIKKTKKAKAKKHAGSSGKSSVAPGQTKTKTNPSGTQTTTSQGQVKGP